MRCNCGANLAIPDEPVSLPHLPDCPSVAVEVLAALNGLLSVFVGLPAARNYQSQIQAARKAIAKAEGK